MVNVVRLYIVLYVIQTLVDNEHSFCDELLKAWIFIFRDFPEMRVVRI